MTLSAYERRVLEDMEHELALSTGPGRTHRARRPAPYRAAGWTLAGVTGPTLIAVGLALATGFGILAALAGYALTVLTVSAAVTTVANRTRGRTHRTPQVWHRYQPGPGADQ
jgi:hypothetical protein